MSMTASPFIHTQITSAEDVINRRRQEWDGDIAFPAFSRIVVKDRSGADHVFWLVERWAGDLRIQRTWTGTAVGGVVDRTAFLSGDVVSKNTKFGLLLDQLSQSVGVRAPLTEKLEEEWGPATIVESTYYAPVRDDAVNGAMLIIDGEVLHFRSLKLALGELAELRGQLFALDSLAVEATIEEAIRQREELIAEFVATRRERIRHIITSASLRVQPKLDSEQLRVKQLQVLSGHLVIEGAPGTGKTTTLVDRINFLTDPQAPHMAELSADQRKRLANSSSAYVFFTPTELLMHYLREAMNVKGLLADARKLKTWPSYREDLARRFAFLSSEEDRSRFTKDRRAFKAGLTTYDLTAHTAASLIDAIMSPFSAFLLSQHSRLLSVRAEAAAEPTLVRSIQTSLADASEKADVRSLMRIFENLRVSASQRIREQQEQSREALTKAEARLHAAVRANPNLYEQLLLLVAPTDPDQRDRTDEVDVGDEALEAGGMENESEQDDAREAAEQVVVDNAARLGQRLRGLLRKLALREGLPGVRLRGVEATLFGEVESYIDQDAVRVLAPLVLTSIFRRVTDGAERNVVDQVAPYYRWVRRVHLAPFLSSFAAEGDLVATKRVCPDDLDCLVFVQLWVAREFMKTVGGSGSKGRVMTTMADELRELVAIDEATDFSPIQLGCMAMLGNPDYDCVTLSGDLMQRLTADGLRRWDEYEAIADTVGAPSLVREGLGVSYRQSQQLLELSGRLYRASTGLESPTRSPYPPSEHDPKPLLHFTNDVADSADWIARRIVEIRKAYEEHAAVPTIAVLVPDEDRINGLADALEASPSLGANIDVDRCHEGRLGDGGAVRVFAAEHIKGLEFEAAFFHDLGQTAARFPDLADKLLYVGLSRASLYVGITVLGPPPRVLDLLGSDLADGTWAD